MSVLENRRVGMISLGCVKNTVDSEQMLHMLRQAGMVVTNRPEEAEVLIVNTCGFIDSAKEESINTVLEMAGYKESGRCRVLCVTGCLSQRYRDALLEEIPEIDCMLGVSSYAKLIPMLERAFGGERTVDTGSDAAFLECGRVLTTPPWTAYIKTGDGCDNKCAYCAIPLIRGAYRSRDRGAILGEIRELARKGVREHILIAQDTTRYGRDRGDSLASLMEEAAGIEGVEWLRALYMYPDEVTNELLDTMARHDNICRYLDLPLQHASPAVLERMNRRGTQAHVREMLTRARNAGFCLRTTFIVGFPGETEDDFKRLMDFTEEIGFDRMGAFAYSREEDTAAYDMPGQIDEEIKQERLERLMTLQSRISLERNQTRIGKAEKVLVTGRKGRLYTARSAWEAPDADGEILLKPVQQEKPVLGSFVSARITSADVYDLKAEC